MYAAETDTHGARREVIQDLDHRREPRSIGAEGSDNEREQLVQKHPGQSAALINQAAPLRELCAMTTKASLERAGSPRRAVSTAMTQVA